MINTELITKGATPKNDIIFKKIFGSKGNEGILKDFLEGILEIKIESVKLGLETELLPEFYIGKTSRLDVRAELEDGTSVNVEIQTNMEGYSDKRDLAYWSKLYLKTLIKGKSYSEARKTICIWILDGEVYNFEKYHSKWKITETDIGKTIDFEDFEIHVIELQKFRKLDIIKPAKKEFWLWFIDHTKKELVEMACYSNEQVREAKEIYEKITSDKELMTLIIAEQIDEWDEATRIENATKKGIRQGIEEGENKAKKETAKKMLELGTETEFIEKVTGLSKEEIQKLKEENN